MRFESPRPSYSDHLRNGIGLAFDAEVAASGSYRVTPQAAEITAGNRPVCHIVSVREAPDPSRPAVRLPTGAWPVKLSSSSNLIAACHLHSSQAEARGWTEFGGN